MNILKKLFYRSFGFVNNTQGKVEYIIVGLGNPGLKYENTRHNAGFMAIDYISKNLNVDVNLAKFKGLYAFCEICNKKVMLLKPQTFMNESGQSVLEASSFYKIPPERIVIFLDDINMPVGKIRIKRSGSHGGQNGMKNIINLCGSDKFPRVKIGIGNKPSPEWDLADWVLSKFKDGEKSALYESLENVKEAIKFIIDGNIDKAMSSYN